MTSKTKSSKLSQPEPLCTIIQKRIVGEVYADSNGSGPIEAALSLIGRDLDMHDTPNSIDCYEFTLGAQEFKIEVARSIPNGEVSHYEDGVPQYEDEPTSSRY